MAWIADVAIALTQAPEGYFAIALTSFAGRVLLVGLWEHETALERLMDLCAFTGLPGTAGDIACAAKPERMAQITGFNGYKSPIGGYGFELVAGEEVLPLTCAWNSDVALGYLKQLELVSGQPSVMSETSLAPDARIGPSDRKRLFEAARAQNVDIERMRVAIAERFQVKSSDELTRANLLVVYEELIPSLKGAA